MVNGDRTVLDGSLHVPLRLKQNDMNSFSRQSGASEDYQSIASGLLAMPEDEDQSRGSVPKVITAYDPCDYVDRLPVVNESPVTGSTNRYSWDLYSDSPFSPRSSVGNDFLSDLSPYSTSMSRECSLASIASTSSNLPITALSLMRIQSDISEMSQTSFDSEILLNGISARVANQAYPMSRNGVASFLENVDHSMSTPSPFLLHQRQGSDSSSSSLSSSDSVLSPTEALCMRRSISSKSSSSDSSNRGLNRMTRRHHEQLRQAQNCPIRPKKLEVIESTSSPHMVRIKSSDGSSKEVGVIPRRHGLSRPKNTKLLCRHCNEHPFGFRGEHELQRHTSRAHSKVRKMWICVDASYNGKFLSDCKSCREKKKYGAYYNAAAHLRRAHFHPRKRGRKAKGDTEKRGGKAGGNHPAMETLKEKWMREIEVVVDDSDTFVKLDEGMDLQRVYEEDALEDSLTSSLVNSRYLQLDMSNEAYSLPFGWNELSLPSSKGSSIDPINFLDIGSVFDQRSFDFAHELSIADESVI